MRKSQKSKSANKKYSTLSRINSNKPVKTFYKIKKNIFKKSKTKKLYLDYKIQYY